MKKRLTIGTLVLVIVLFATTLAGCSIGMDSVEEILEKNDLVAQITYYSNGGWFGEASSQIFSRNLYYKENAKAYEITSSTAIKLNSAEDLYNGWYFIKTVQKDGETYFVCDVETSEIGTYVIDGRTAIMNHEGQNVIKKADYDQLIKLANVPLLILDSPFDFKNYKLSNGEKLYLAAGWVPNQKVEYVLLTEGCSEITLENGTKYADRSVISTVLFDSKGVYTVPSDYSLTPVKATDATFVDYYVYEEDVDVNNLTRLADTTNTLSRPEDGSNIKVFVKYTQGADWKVVRFAEDVKAMFATSSNKFYVSRDIDCSNEAAYKFVSQGIYRATIKGNGNTITGIKMQNSDALSSGAAVSLFGNIAQSSTIEDITFDNVTLTCTTKPSQNDSFVNVYLLAHSLRDEAYPTFSNVILSNVKVDITLANKVNIENIPLEALGYNTSEWILVDKANSDILTTEVKIENYELIINTVIVSTDK